MNTEREFDQLARAWMADGPVELADRVLNAALDEVRLVPQRRARAVLGGRPATIGLAGYGVLAFAAGAVLALAVVIAGSAPDIDRPTAPPASPFASNPSASSRLTTTPRPPISQTQRFTSTVNRYSISYPDGWTVKPATQAFRYGSSPSLKDPAIDVITAPDGRTSLYIMSVAIPAGISEYTWRTTQEQLLPDVPTTCLPGVVPGSGNHDQRHGPPVEVGGILGRATWGCRSIQYQTPITGGRGYEFLLFPMPVGSGSDEEQADRDYFATMLGSIELDR
jgi:hypothetical protein